MYNAGCPKKKETDEVQYDGTEQRITQIFQFKLEMKDVECY